MQRLHASQAMIPRNFKMTNVFVSYHIQYFSHFFFFVCPCHINGMSLTYSTCIQAAKIITTVYACQVTLGENGTTRQLGKHPKRQAPVSQPSKTFETTLYRAQFYRSSRKDASLPILPNQGRLHSSTLIFNVKLQTSPDFDQMTSFMRGPLISTIFLSKQCILSKY